MSIQKKHNISKSPSEIEKEELAQKSDRRESIHTAILIILTVVFTGLAGFAFGKIDGATTSKKSLTVETIPPELLSGSVINSLNEAKASDARTPSELGQKSNPSTALVVGSKNSDKYHYPWCSGAKRINPENLISFPSFEAAREAGYSPAGNCPGLE